MQKRSGACIESAWYFLQTYSINSVDYETSGILKVKLCKFDRKVEFVCSIWIREYTLRGIIGKNSLLTVNYKLCGRANIKYCEHYLTRPVSSLYSIKVHLIIFRLYPSQWLYISPAPKSCSCEQLCLLGNALNFICICNVRNFQTIVLSGALPARFITEVCYNRSYESKW